jgi:hypothetical protein
MALTANRINELVLDQLATEEKRLLALTVAVRKGLGESQRVRGDLSQSVKLCLRKLVASKQVIDMDGVFSLSKEIKLRERSAPALAISHG